MLIWGNALHGQRSSVDPKLPCIEHLMAMTCRQNVQIPLIGSHRWYVTPHLISISMAFDNQ